MIAVDTSVIVDLLGDDDALPMPPTQALRIGPARAGPVVACEVVISEVVRRPRPRFDVLDTLEEAGLGFLPLGSLRSAVRAGEMQRRYNERLRAAGRDAAPRTCPTSSSAPTHCCSAAA